MNLKTCLFYAAASVVLPVYAADTYTMDPEFTLPTFEVEHVGFTTQRGRFDRAEGRVVLDFPAQKGIVEFTVYTDSLDMGSRSWTVHVSSAGLFNIEQYPTMSFRSDTLQFKGDKVVSADGALTLIGVTKPVHLQVNHFACGPNPLNKRAMCAADITATIKRSDFGMLKYIPSVSDEIKINVPVEAYKD